MGGGGGARFYPFTGGPGNRRATEGIGLGIGGIVFGDYSIVICCSN